MQSYSFQGAYSFGPGAGRPEKSETKKEDKYFIPAPNEYDQFIFVDKPQSPAYTFGYEDIQLEGRKQQLNTLTNNCNYNIRTQIEENLRKNKGPKYGKAIIKKPAKKEKPEKFHEENTKSSAPQYCFGYKFDLDEAKRIRDITTPGPGQYYPDDKVQNEEELFRSSTGWTAFRSTYLQKPSTGLGVGSKDSIYKSQSKQNPGPAEYKPKDVICRPQIQGFKFTNKKQYDSYLKIDKSIPGPGQYTPKLPRDIEVTSKPKGYTLGPKLQSCMINLHNKDTPPPNAYNLKDITSPQSNIMIGTSTRKPLLEIGVKTPGPGAYNPYEQLASKNTNLVNTLGNSKRQPLSHAENNNVPGPGSYQTDKTSLNGPKYGIKGKGLKEISAFKFENPSPSQYNPSCSITKYSSPSYGTTKNSRFFKLEDQTPAPNKYLIKYNELKGPNYSFGAKKCKPANFTMYNKQLEPGPGSYDIPSSIGNIPKYLKQDPSQIYREIGKYAQYIGFIKK